MQELTPSDYLWDRVPGEISALAELPRREVESAAGHRDPRVRSLALGVLALRGDPRSLPTMVAVALDDAPGLPAREMYAAMMVGPGGRSWIPHPQTVGEIARSFVRAYMEAAGCYGGIEGRGSYPGFADYWRAHGNRTHCLSWFKLDLNRASQGSTPMAADRLPKIAALRRRIDALETPYRDWILLSLAAPWETGTSEPGAESLASEADLLQAARRLGRERVLGLLRGEEVLPDDPDLRYDTQGPFQAQRVVPFLLRHAGELLDPGSAGELQTIGYRHLEGQPVGHAPTLVTSRWFTAAADLDREHAAPILSEALERFGSDGSVSWQDDRATLALALWRHVGTDALPRILDWFFSEEPSRGAFGFGRHRFATALSATPHAALLRAILCDGRVAGLDWQTLHRLAEAANTVAGDPVVPPGELRSTSHPLGEGHYHWERERARAEYPAATAALESTLARWRAALAAWARGQK